MYHIAIVNRDDEREIYATDTAETMDSGILRSGELVGERAGRVGIGYSATCGMHVGSVFRQIWECEDSETGIEAIVFEVTED